MTKTLITAVFGSLLATAAWAQTGQQQQPQQQPQQQQQQQQQQEKQLQAEVLGVHEDNLVLNVNGAAVPVQVEHDTKIEGQETRDEEEVQSRLRNEFQPGQMVSVTYSTKDLENHAKSIEKQPKQRQQQQRQQQQQQPQQQQQQPQR